MTTSNANLNGSSGPVGDWEELGRAIFSSSQSRRAAKKVPFHVFLEEPGERKISVDRLTLAPSAEAVANAGRVAAKRNPPRNFYGWAVVTTDPIRAAGFVVKDSPLTDNRYHADIILPRDAADNVDAQREYAIKLAGMSKWRPYPPEPDDETTAAE